MIKYYILVLFYKGNEVKVEIQSIKTLTLSLIKSHKLK